MKKTLLVLLVLILAGGSYYYYQFLRNTPVSALMQAARATQTHDLTTFNRFVDVDSVTSGVVDDIAGQSSLLNALIPGGGFALHSGLGLLKPQLNQVAHTEVKRFVETGSLEAASATAPKRIINLSLLGLLSRIVGPGSTFKGIKYSTINGNEARVGIEFARPNQAGSLIAEVALRRQPDGHWQVKRLANLGTLLRQSARLDK